MLIETYCIDINTQFQSGYKTRYNATEKILKNWHTMLAMALYQPSTKTMYLRS